MVIESNIILATNSLLLLRNCHSTTWILIKTSWNIVVKNSAGLLKIEKRTEILLLATFWNQFFFFSDNSKIIYPEWFENRLLDCQCFLNQNKQLISKLDDSTRKISSLEISVLQKRWKEVKLSSSKLNGKEKQLTKLNVRNFNMDGMGKFQNENFKKENK